MDKERLEILLWNAIDLLLANYSKEEIMEELGMSKQEFESMGKI